MNGCTAQTSANGFRKGLIWQTVHAVTAHVAELASRKCSIPNHFNRLRGCCGQWLAKLDELVDGNHPSPWNSRHRFLLRAAGRRKPTQCCAS